MIQKKSSLVSNEKSKEWQDAEDEEEDFDNEEEKKEGEKMDADLVSDGSEKESDREGYDPDDTNNDNGIYATSSSQKM